MCSRPAFPRSRTDYYRGDSDSDFDDEEAVGTAVLGKDRGSVSTATNKARNTKGGTTPTKGMASRASVATPTKGGGDKSRASVATPTKGAKGSVRTILRTIRA